MWKQLGMRRCISALTAVILTVGIAAACEKKEDTTAVSSVKASTATAATTAKQTTAAKTAAVTTKESTAAAAAATEVTVTEVTGDVQEEGTTGGGSTESTIDKEKSDEIAEGLEKIEFGIGSLLGTDINIDFGGKTIKHINSAETNIWGDDDSKRMEYRTLYRRLAEAEKKYNFKLEQELMISGLNTKIVNDTLAGVWLADVFVYSSSAAYPAWVQNKILLPLDEYIDYELPVIKANPYLYYGSLWKGRHYGYTCMYEYAFANCIFNRDVLNREGIPDILDMVTAKQWNYEAFLDAAKKCTKDTNGDGILDQWGVSAPYTSELFRQMLYSNGSALLYEEDGVHYYNLNRGPAMRTLQFVSEMVNIHKVYKQHTSAEFQKGTCAFWLSDYWNNAALLKVGMNTGLAPLPMGPDVSDYQNMNPPTIYGISSMCKNPREVTQIIAEAMTLWDENLNPIPMYKEVMDIYGYDYWWSPINVARRITTEKEYQVSYLPLYSLFTADKSLGYPGLTSVIYGSVYNKIFDGSMSVSQAVSSVEGKVEDILSQFR